MPFIDTKDLAVWERLPGWRGRIFHSENMTFAYWEFDAGVSIHEYQHPSEEVWNVITGQIEVTIDREVHRAGPGTVAIRPVNFRYGVHALCEGLAPVVDHPVRSNAPVG